MHGNVRQVVLYGTNSSVVRGCCLVSVAVSSLPDDVVDELDLAEDEALRWETDCEPCMTEIYLHTHKENCAHCGFIRHSSLVFESPVYPCALSWLRLTGTPLPSPPLTKVMRACQL